MTAAEVSNELQTLRMARQEVLRLIAQADARNEQYKKSGDRITAKWYEGEADGLHKMRRVLGTGPTVDHGVF